MSKKDLITQEHIEKYIDIGTRLELKVNGVLRTAVVTYVDEATIRVLTADGSGMILKKNGPSVIQSIGKTYSGSEFENFKSQLQNIGKEKTKLKANLVTEKKAIPLELKPFTTVKVNINRFFKSKGLGQYTGQYVGTTPDGMILVDFNTNGLGEFEGTTHVNNGVVEFFPNEVYLSNKKLNEIQLQDSKPPLLYHRKPTMKTS